MAQAIPVLESVTPSFFSVAPSPWKSRSPIFTWSMKTSSKALSWSGVCFSLWAIARFPPEVKSRTSTPTKTPSSVRTYRVLFIALLPAWACAPPWSLVGAVVRPLAVGDTRLQRLIDVVRAAGVRRGLGEDVLVLAPHHVLVLDLLGRGHREPRPADAVEVVARIDPHETPGQRGHALRRVGPRPRGGEHADRAHLPDLVVQHLVRVPVDVGDAGVGLEDLVNLAPVPHPEVPGRIVLVERVVGEDDHGLTLGPAGQRLVEPLELIDRKSTRLNSSHSQISYAVFCLKKKNSRRLSSLCMTANLRA